MSEAALASGPHPRVMMALSGGVDSAVSLLLLKRQGYDVEALFMKNWEEDDENGYCAAAEDLADAERVCDRLDVPLHTVNFSACIATGHYARIGADGQDSDTRRLLTGVDPDKDQSYFLYMLTQAQLRPALFPIGDMHKGDVRRMAREAGLETHDKKDSTGICFIGERPFREFLARFLTPKPGDIESVDGARLGAHDGLMYYTMGQRQGLGIGGRAGGSGEPWYVVGKDLDSDTLIVAQGHDHPALYSRALQAGELHWIRGAAPALPFRCEAKIRYRQARQACEVLPRNGGCQVRFDNPPWAAAPGQSVVFYAGDECLGGGIIDSVDP